MTGQHVLALYDQEQRQELTRPGMRREVSGSIVRQVSLTGDVGFITYSALSASDAGEAIRQQIAYFGAIGRDFEWICYSHDTPADLLERLKASGFGVGEREALLALDLTKWAHSLREPIKHDIRRLSGGDELKDLILIGEEVWERSYNGVADHLARDLQERPDLLSVYIAYVNEVPASAAWTYFKAGSHFAALWGGSTRRAFRGKGLYRALVTVRAQEALDRGVSYLTVYASPMSQLILEGLGFNWLSDIHPCFWFPKSASGDAYSG